MPGTKGRGAPYSVGTDVWGSTGRQALEDLAQHVDDRPGVSSLTTPERDALSGVDLWEGRVVYNTTTGRLEVREGSAWVQLDHGDLAGLGDDDHSQYLNNTRGDARYLGLTAKAADADKLDGYDSSKSATGDTVAVRNANGTLTAADPTSSANLATRGWTQTQLDGKLGTGAKAADSDLLDGLDSGAFARSTSGTYAGNGSASLRAIAVGFTARLVVVSYSDSGTLGWAISAAGHQGSSGVGFGVFGSSITGPSTSDGRRPRLDGGFFDVLGQLNASGVTYNYVAFG